MAGPLILPLILAGGAGTRLWPVSRDSMPKQFMPLAGNKSTFQRTLSLIANPALFAPPIIMTVSDFRFVVEHQAKEIGCEHSMVLEPARRSSAPAIAAGALIAKLRDADVIVLALPADHLVRDVELFHSSCDQARTAANAGHIVAFGIAPTAPKTGYAYIARGAPLDGDGACTIERFVEKPGSAAASLCFETGCFWNSGYFLFRADTLEAELRRHSRKIWEAVVASVEGATEEAGFIRLASDPYRRAPRKSFDCAVMEKTDRAAMVEGRFRWSDITSWDAVYDSAPHDDAFNAIRGDVVALDVENSLIHSEDRLAAVVGVKELIVVTTSDAVLVVPRSRAHDVKDLVAKLKKAARAEASDHRRVYRPWGHYESVDVGERFQVKRIVVAPHGKLSLQKHLHRAEHWVVVRGTAEVTIGEETKTVYENHSVYVPLGAVHRLANPGRIPLELIEIQTGSYLGEDDILRLEDVYRRVA